MRLWAAGVLPSCEPSGGAARGPDDRGGAAARKGREPVHLPEAVLAVDEAEREERVLAPVRLRMRDPVLVAEDRHGRRESLDADPPPLVGEGGTRGPALA